MDGVNLKRVSNQEDCVHFLALILKNTAVHKTTSNNTDNLLKTEYTLQTCVRPLLDLILKLSTLCMGFAAAAFFLFLFVNLPFNDIYSICPLVVAKLQTQA